MNPPSASRFSLALAAALLGVAPVASALTYTWNGTTNGNWSTASNWIGGVLPTFGNTTDIVYYPSTGNMTNMPNSRIAGNRVIRSLTFTSNVTAATSISFNNGAASASNLTFEADSGPAKITIESGSTGAITIGTNATSGSLLGTAWGNMTLASDLLIEHNGSGTLGLTRPIFESGGSRSITKNGTGTLWFVTSGSNATNTFSGGLFINNGQVYGNNAGSFGTGSITLGETGSSNSATLGLRGSVDVANDILVTSGGTRILSAEALNIAAPTFSGNITLNGDLDVNMKVVTTAGNRMVLSGNIAGAGNLTLSRVSGVGDYIGLNGNNTYTGNTLINAGTEVRTGSATGIGDTSRVIIADDHVSQALHLRGGGNEIIGSLESNSTTALVSLWNGNLTTGGNNLSTTFAGIIESNGTALTGLTKTGNGTFTLTNSANSYMGPTTISGGVLEVATLANGGAVSSIGNSTSGAANLVLNGGTLRYSASNGAQVTTNRGFTLAANSTIEGNGTSGSSIRFTGAIAYGTADEARTLTLSGANTNDNRIDGVINDNGTGAVSLVKDGAGTWRLMGNNTYSGGTVVNGGRLNVGQTGSTGTVGLGAVTLNNDAILGLTRSNAYLMTNEISGNGSVYFTGGAGTGNLILAGNNSYTGVTRMDFNGNITIGNGGTSGTAGLGNIEINGNATNTLSINRSDAITINNTITGGGHLAQIGNGTTTLTGINTYARSTTISAGVLEVTTLANGGSISFNGSSSIGNSTNAASNLVLNGGTLRFSGTSAGTTSTDRLFTVSANSTIDASGANNATSLVRFSNTGDIAWGTADQDRTLTLNAGTAAGFNNNRLDSRITDNGAGVVSLVKSGIGTWQITANNTYSGTTTVSDGVLRVGTGGGTGSVGTGEIILGTGAGLYINRDNSSVVTMDNLISGSGRLDKTGTGILVLTSDNTYGGLTNVFAGVLQIGNNGTTGTMGAGNATIDSTGILRFSRSNELVINQAIEQGLSAGGSVEQVGSGTTILNGTNTYTGNTTVSAGKLVINGSTSSTSLVSVATGATLGGNGTVGGDTTIAGFLAPGNSPGVLSFSNDLTLESTAVTTMEIDGTALGTGYDSINVGGELTYGGTLTLDLGTLFTVGSYTFDLFAFTTPEGSGSAFSAVALGGVYSGSLVETFFGSGIWGLATSVGGNNQTWQFSEASGDLSLLVTPVPEPRAALLGGLGLLALLRRRRH